MTKFGNYFEWVLFPRANLDLVCDYGSEVDVAAFGTAKFTALRGEPVTSCTHFVASQQEMGLFKCIQKPPRVLEKHL